DQNLEVQVRTTGVTRVAQGADALTSGDLLPDLHVDLRQVGVPGPGTVAVRDLDEVPVGTCRTGLDDLAGIGGPDGSALGGGEVQPGVPTRTPHRAGLPEARGDLV